MNDPITAALAAALRPLLVDAIREVLAEHNGAPSSDALLDTQGIAQKLGVSLPTARRMNLPHVMIGDHRRYHWPSVLQHLRTQHAGGAQ